MARKKSIKSRAKKAYSSAKSKVRKYAKTERGGGMLTGVAIGMVGGYLISKSLNA
jgi:hypothetical protein